MQTSHRPHLSSWVNKLQKPCTAYSETLNLHISMEHTCGWSSTHLDDTVAISTLCFLAMLSRVLSSFWNQSHPPTSRITLAYLLLLYVFALTLQSQGVLHSMLLDCLRREFLAVRTRTTQGLSTCKSTCAYTGQLTRIEDRRLHDSLREWDAHKDHPNGYLSSDW